MENLKEDLINFAYWLNIQRYKETHFMNKKELEKMYKYYIECLENGTYKN